MRSPGRPRGVPLVLSLQALVVALVVAWFATGHASAPDAGLQQLDVLAVHERVPASRPWAADRRSCSPPAGARGRVGSRSPGATSRGT